MDSADTKFHTPRKERLEKIARGVRNKLTFRHLWRTIRRFLPIINWLPQYEWKRSFFGDLSGGLTMAVFAVPRGIAQASITGVDPVYGLYTAIFPSFIYIFFGTSKHNSLVADILSVQCSQPPYLSLHVIIISTPISGGFVVLSLMTRAAIEKVMLMQASMNTWDNSTTDIFNTTNPNHFAMPFEPDGMNETDFEFTNDEINANVWEASQDSVKPIEVAATLVFLSACIQVNLMNFSDNPLGTLLITYFYLQILMGILRFEHLTCYFSQQVMSGFVVGGCVHVFFAQIGDILGIQLEKRAGPGYLYYRVQDLFTHLNETKPATVTMSAMSITFLLFGKEILQPWLSQIFLFPIPYDLILAIVAITATNFAELADRHQIIVVGNIPTRFPPPSLPRFDLLPSVCIDALSIAAIAVAIHVTVAKIVEKRYEYNIKCGQEFYALGFVGLLSSLFPVFPVTSGFVRTVIGKAVGGCTQLTSLFSALALVSVILYIGPALEYLPKCVLASMIMVTMKSYILKFTELRKLWPVFKIDCLIWIMSMLLTICYDMAEGLALAIAFALLTTIFRNQWLRWHVLSKNDDGDFRETKKRQLEFIEGDTCIFRLDGPLIFTSVDRFVVTLRECVKKWRQKHSQRSFVTIEEMNRQCAQHMSISGFSQEYGTEHEITDEEQLEPGDSNESNNKRSSTSNVDLAQRKPLKYEFSLVIDCSGFPYVDYLGLDTIKKMYTELSRDGIDVYLAEAREDLRKMFEQTDFYKVVDRAQLFTHLSDAVNASEEKRKQSSVVLPDSQQIEQQDSENDTKVVDVVASDEAIVDLKLQLAIGI
ncbi:unnamed protein product [Anisakis simplex]|uniref:Sulfate permease family protein 3 (inferred by orthology to a C. elegans protein) n=1 Tax=Anisakis simplex TaxID=6269 RepID=A0A0M3K4Y6_ANISI|nr:unnamed protein product [Anisakis simplex]